MTAKVRRVPYKLDARGIKKLPFDEITAILRGADELIMTGGRSLLSKILKGSQQARVLELGLQDCPVYGYYAHHRPEEILARVDWMILNGYLDIKYDYRLPMIVYTQKGWDIEKYTRAEEFLQEFDDMIAAGTSIFEMGYLKDRNREMILILLQKVEGSRDPKYIPLLRAWDEVDYKKVRRRISQVIATLSRSTSPKSDDET